MDKAKLDLIWDTSLQEVQKELSEANFKTWFLSTTLEEVDPVTKTALINTPNNFVSKNLQAKYSQKILKLLKKHASVEILELDFKVAGSKKGSARKNTANTELKESQSSHNTHSKPSYIKKSLGHTMLPINPKYSFNNFVVGGSNELAYTVAQAISKAPGERFNPLFIYGEAGKQYLSTPSCNMRVR